MKEIGDTGVWIWKYLFSGGRLFIRTNNISQEGHRTYTFWYQSVSAAIESVELGSKAYLRVSVLTYRGYLNYKVKESSFVLIEWSLLTLRISNVNDILR
jgi:hypothetical protein